MSLEAENKALREALRAMNDLMFAQTGFDADELARLVADNDMFRDAFKQMIVKLEAGAKISSAFCSYCDERWPSLDGASTETARDYARRHAAMCEKHPLRVTDTAVERLLFMLHIYNGHRLDSRGPNGCVFEAISALSPTVAEYLAEHGADAAYERWFDAETATLKRPIGAP